LQKEIVLLKERLESNFHLAVETITILKKEIKLRNQKLDQIINTKEHLIPKNTKNRDPQINK
jgi:FtsZ-binding cell division protein ZapB